MGLQVASALSEGSVDHAAAELSKQIERRLGSVPPKLLLVFGSTAQPLAELAPLLARRYPGAALLGLRLLVSSSSPGTRRTLRQSWPLPAISWCFRALVAVSRKIRKQR